MSKVNEPTAAYYSAPQINALKKKLKASIERENDVEVLERVGIGKGTKYIVCRIPDYVNL